MRKLLAAYAHSRGRRITSRTIAKSTARRSTGRSTASCSKEPLAGQNIANLEVGIYYTPIDNGDHAHSDLTFTGPVPEERSEEHDRLVMALSGKFNALHPDQISLLPNANVTTDGNEIAERLSPRCSL